LVGMGSVVTRDVPPERMWFGAPARDVSRAPLPADVVRYHDERGGDPALPALPVLL
jgi:acetyltransferase-like isoleucine patch superfamily enzyme